MSNEPNRMSTQDDPENFPWQNSGMQGSGIVFSNRMHSSSFRIQQNIVHASWLSASTDATDGAQATLAARRAQIGGRYSRATFITPATRSMTLGPEPIEMKVSDHITVPDRAGSLEGDHEDSPISTGPKEAVPESESCTPAHKNADWVEQLSRAIPKQLREQIVGDLCEVRARMVAEGCSPLKIFWTTLSQFLLSILWWLWTRFGWIMLLYNRVSEWLSPNK